MRVKFIWKPERVVLGSTWRPRAEPTGLHVGLRVPPGRTVLGLWPPSSESGHRGEPAPWEAESWLQEGQVEKVRTVLPEWVRVQKNRLAQSSEG